MNFLDKFTKARITLILEHRSIGYLSLLFEPKLGDKVGIIKNKFIYTPAYMNSSVEQITHDLFYIVAKSIIMLHYKKSEIINNDKILHLLTIGFMDNSCPSFPLKAMVKKYQPVMQQYSKYDFSNINVIKNNLLYNFADTYYKVPTILNIDNEILSKYLYTIYLNDQYSHAGPYLKKFIDNTFDLDTNIDCSQLEHLVNNDFINFMEKLLLQNNYDNIFQAYLPLLNKVPIDKNLAILLKMIKSNTIKNELLDSSIWKKWYKKYRQFLV